MRERKLASIIAVLIARRRVANCTINIARFARATLGELSGEVSSATLDTSSSEDEECGSVPKTCFLDLLSRSN